MVEWHEFPNIMQTHSFPAVYAGCVGGWAYLVDGRAVFWCAFDPAEDQWRLIFTRTCEVHSYHPTLEEAQTTALVLLKLKGANVD